MLKWLTIFAQALSVELSIILAVIGPGRRWEVPPPLCLLSVREAWTGLSEERDQDQERHPHLMFSLVYRRFSRELQAD